MKDKFKVYLHSEELRRKAQEKAFELGLKWPAGDTCIKHLASPFLYFEFDSMQITKSEWGTVEDFINEPYKELTPEEWFKYEPPVEEMTDEEILGKVWKYNGNKWYSKIISYQPGVNHKFYVEENWWSKKELLSEFKHADSLEAMARGEV